MQPADQVRSPKAEGRKKSEGRNPKPEEEPDSEVRSVWAAAPADRPHGRPLFGFRPSGFFRPSAFGFRIFRRLPACNRPPSVLFMKSCQTNLNPAQARCRCGRGKRKNRGGERRRCRSCIAWRSATRTWTSGRPPRWGASPAISTAATPIRPCSPSRTRCGCWRGPKPRPASPPAWPPSATSCSLCSRRGTGWFR